MQVVNPQLIHGKKVLLRYDIDVPIECKAQSVKCKVKEDFRLRLGLPTLQLCLEHAVKVIVMGHIGRPNGKVVSELSVEPIRQWFPKDKKLIILENLRFDPREEACDVNFAKELAAMGDVFVNEAFAAYRPSVSTTVLPTLLPGYAGLRFTEEVKVLTDVRDYPRKPFVAIMGGAKVADKLPVIKVLAQRADAVLVGGKLVSETRDQKLELPKNVLVGMLTDDGLDIAPQTTSTWNNLISRAAEIIWNGPVGKIENRHGLFSNENGKLKIENLGSAKGTYEIAKMILKSNARIIIGGGDTVAFLGNLGMLAEYEKKGFVSTGGGAMLKLLAEGTLPTIQVLN